jgi:hypothetical protein
MKRPSRLAVLLLAAPAVAALVLAGCATGPRPYRWHGYDQALFNYYQRPETAAAFRESLELAVKEDERDGLRVPPGIRAEIGTLYLQAGDRARARAWYERERSAWPESAELMAKLIAALGGSGG